MMGVEMSAVNLAYVSSSLSDNVVKAEHFSGNIISTKNTSSGAPTPDFVDAIENLDIETLRYPAGQPDIVYAHGMLQDGELHGDLVSFLDWARLANYQVLLVTPTFESYPGPDVISEFVRLVLHGYGDIVAGFEVGNEYWQSQSEEEYGIIANETILAIEGAASETDYDPTIMVQMANPAGEFSNFPAGVEGWRDRVVSANEEIIDQLSNAARDAIDVVVEHYYFNDTPVEFSGSSAERNYIQEKFDVWQNEINNPLDLHITEWNITSRNLDSLGMRAAPTLIQQFEYMISMGVDAAYVWPPHHNTSNDLAGSGEVIVDPQSGLVINSIGGAVFDLMSSSLRGASLMDLTIDGLNVSVNLNAYASDENTIIYVSSMAEEVLDISFDMAGYIENFTAIDGVLVGYDTNTSNGTHYNYQIGDFVNSDFVMVEGERYYLNEHDVKAKITLFDEIDLGGGTNLSFQLKPFEVMQITFHQTVTGTGGGPFEVPTPLPVDEGQDIVGGSENDTITGGTGNDSIDSGSGDDWIFGGLGDDQIIGNRGNDTIEANEGEDTVNGWGGNDEIFGGSGHDDLYGQQGSDTIFGGDGNDKINGGEDADYLRGGGGDDTIEVSFGEDSVFGDSGNDLIRLLGEDLSITGRMSMCSGPFGSPGTKRSIMLGNFMQNIVQIDGGDGYDTVELSANNDALILQSFDATVLGDIGSSDVTTFSSLTNIEKIMAMDGDDFINLTNQTDGFVGQEIDIYGGRGNDTIWGSDASEEIYGGHGDDVINGGAGMDTIFGGSGADVFEFTSASRNVFLADFHAGQGDTIEFLNDSIGEFDPIDVSYVDGTLSVGYRTYDTGDREVFTIGVGIEVDESQIVGSLMFF